ncbi:MAG TPA: T9SS type A sorting domain-containing protein [Bacteroidia bacterium]|nr:T9SS type A sorting domain-containing protein [Bacteroidia bacterium]
MKISINEPCHENWDAMTPNQQGAFCGSCKKDVVDFSKMGIEQIKSFFSKPQEGKVCGRFEEKQLQELSFDDFFAKFTYWNFSKKFAVIFFMAFGFWIFSNSNAVAQSNHMMKGEVAYIPEKPKPVQKDTTRKHTATPVNTEKQVIMGKVKCTKPEPVKEPEPMIMGDVAIQQPITVIESIPVNTKKDTSEIITVKQVVLIDPTPKNNIIIPDAVIKADTLANGTKRIIKNDNFVLIYPNPSNGNFVLEVPAQEGTKQTAYILDENGKLVFIKKTDGTTTFDASGLKAGIYTISIIGSAVDSVISKRLVIVK